MLIPIDKIVIVERLRSVTDTTVDALAESIDTVGLLNPVTVAARNIVHCGISVPGYRLIAGMHRLEACKRLGHTEIEACVVTLDELHRQLAEVDENLCGTKLTPSERALFMRRRKDIHIALHPETRAGVAGGKARQGAASDNLSFAADTAAKTGVTVKTVEREAARGAAIAGDVLAQVKGTKLDRGVELDALAKMEPEEQRAAIKQARAGGNASVRNAAPMTAIDKARLAMDKLTDAEASVVIADRLGCPVEELTAGKAVAVLDDDIVTEYHEMLERPHLTALQECDMVAFCIDRSSLESEGPALFYTFTDVRELHDESTKFLGMTRFQWMDLPDDFLTFWGPFMGKAVAYWREQYDWWRVEHEAAPQWDKGEIRAEHERRDKIRTAQWKAEREARQQAELEASRKPQGKRRHA